VKIENKAIAAASLATNYTSEPLWVGHMGMYSIQLYITGTPLGTFKLQACNSKNDNQPNIIPSGTDLWSDIANTAITDPAGTTAFWNMADPGYQWVRFVWTDTGAVGSITGGRFYAKGF